MPKTNELIPVYEASEFPGIMDEYHSGDQAALPASNVNIALYPAKKDAFCGRLEAVSHKDREYFICHKILKDKVAAGQTYLVVTEQSPTAYSHHVGKMVEEKDGSWQLEWNKKSHAVGAASVGGGYNIIEWLSKDHIFAILEKMAAEGEMP